METWKPPKSSNGYGSKLQICMQISSKSCSDHGCGGRIPFWVRNYKNQPAIQNIIWNVVRCIEIYVFNTEMYVFDVSYSVKLPVLRCRIFQTIAISPWWSSKAIPSSSMAQRVQWALRSLSHLSHRLSLHIECAIAAAPITRFPQFPFLVFPRGLIPWSKHVGSHKCSSPPNDPCHLYPFMIIYALFSEWIRPSI